MTLRPSATIHRILISSAAKFVGEYEAPELYVTHAFPHNHDRTHQRAPFRSSYVVSFCAEEPKKVAGTIIPDYRYVGESLCDLLSVFFGKHFESHGLIETHGWFNIPNMRQYEVVHSTGLPQNDSDPREDIPIPLELEQISKILTFYSSEVNINLKQAFWAACKFYRQALLSFEQSPEIAYLSFITAGEVLSNSQHPQNDDLLDAETQQILEKITIELQDGTKLRRALESKLRQIKARFKFAINELIDDGFFISNSDKSAFPTRLKKDDFLKRIGAAYDLRSKHLHSGASFGTKVLPRVQFMRNETQLGKPVYGDPEMEKILSLAPTLVGLERTIRYGLMRFAERNGLFCITTT